MSSRRAGNRYRMLLLLGLGIGLALGSFWLLEVMQKSAVDRTPGALRNEPDYYVEHFNFVRMSKTGEARYNIAGTRMIHRPLDDTYEITLPVVHSLSQTAPPLTMRSQRAMVDPESSKIHMYDKVDADRPASATSEHFHLMTEYLLILPDDDVIQTDKAADLTLGSAHMTGIGMVANNAKREFSMARRVHGTYPPKGATAGP
ncbi:MAG: LPS export ABC transporter periplasmic protein LptC [Herminiimonas sp.]|nr:LPS export ABC transporter periplasmic protein LptC [Herminiimonas sp.]